MKIDELKSKTVNQMSKEELEIYMLNIIKGMNKELENINRKYREDNDRENRIRNKKIL